MWRFLFYLTAVAFITPVHPADWYETSGWAPILNGDLQTARERAIEHALRQSLDLAGGHIQSVEDVVDGVITGQRLQWRSHSAVEQLELVRERSSGQRHEVVLRTLIRPQIGACSGQSYQPSAVLTPFEVAQADHLNLGQIHLITETSAFRFSRLLSQHGKNIQVAQLIREPQGLNRYIATNQSKELADYSRRIAREYNSQYVITGVFHDLSATAKQNRRLAFWQPARYQRQFELSLYVLDGYNGELLTTASIKGQAPWPYAYNEAVDVRSEAFWQNAFGQQLELGLRDLVYGINDKLHCTALKGLIIKTSDNQVYANIGERHQVTLGAKAQVLHRSGFLDELGQYREQWVVNPIEFEVTELYHSSSQLRPRNNEAFIGLQERDLVVIK